jgi:hypothetical protein
MSKKRNPILLGKTEALTPRYYVQIDEGRAFFKDGQELLQFLQNNDPTECGCQLMTDDEYSKIMETLFE